MILQDPISLFNLSTEDNGDAIFVMDQVQDKKIQMKIGFKK